MSAVHILLTPAAASFPRSPDSHLGPSKTDPEYVLDAQGRQGSDFSWAIYGKLIGHSLQQSNIAMEIPCKNCGKNDCAWEINRTFP